MEVIPVLMIDFKVDDFVGDMQWTAFRTFIEDLRRGLEHRRILHDQLSVLPCNMNTRWFDIVLRTNRNSTTLRLQVDNLYLDGYRMREGNWVEFGSNTTNPPSVPLFIDSAFLGFDGTYPDLEGAFKHTRDGMKLGQYQLEYAVDILATSMNPVLRAKALLTVIQMICEGTRFDSISSHIASNFQNGLPLHNNMLEQQKNWGNLSVAMLHADANPKAPFTLGLNSQQRTEIRSIGEALNALGIVQDVKEKKLSKGPSKAVVDGLPKGKSLAQVSSVCYMSQNKSEKGNLYGKISVSNGQGSQDIYNRNREHCESLSPGDLALLTGPAQSILAYDSFSIDVDLVYEYNNGLLDDEVIKGLIVWNVYQTRNEYEKPLFKEVMGSSGLVIVNHVVFRDAVEATVEVFLINGDEDSPAKVYGKVTTCNSDFMNESVLFRKTSDEDIDVRPGQLIPFSRSLVVVPLNSSLIVEADLWDCGVSSNNEIVRGTAEFPAELCGTFENNIFGDYRAIKVKVTWT